MGTPVMGESSGTSGMELGVEAGPAALRDVPAFASEEEEEDPISSALRETPDGVGAVVAALDAGPECFVVEAAGRPRRTCDLGRAGASLKMLE